MHPNLSAFLSVRLLDRRDGYRRQVCDELRALRAFDGLDDDARRRVVDERLAALLNHALRHVPRWREAAGGAAPVAPGDARRVLAELPVMRREELQRDPAAFTAGDGRWMRDNATGGSTGNPLRFKVDRLRMISGEAAHLWAHGFAGWRYGERIAMLWGADRDVRSALAGARARVRGWIENIRWYNAFAMGEAEMERFHAGLQAFRPHLLVAYAGAAAAFARFLQERGLRPGYPARAVFSSAEALLPALRRVVEATFAVPVLDRYGSREFGPLAVECPEHAGLHLNERDALFEIDSPEPDRQPGPIRVTYLCNYAMPFLRYETGDWGRLMSAAPCRCGRRTPRLAPVAGRETDMIRTAAGLLIHGEFFTHLLYGVGGVRSFQFVQDDLNHYRLLLEADAACVTAREAEWRARILEAVGPGAELRIERVAAIPPTASGKHKFTLSRLPPARRGGADDAV